MKVQPHDLENKNTAQLEMVVNIYHVSTDIHLHGSLSPWMLMIIFGHLDSAEARVLGHGMLSPGL